ADLRRLNAESGLRQPLTKARPRGGRSGIVVTERTVADPDISRPSMAEGSDGGIGVGSEELVADVGAIDEGDGLQHGMQPELAQEVLHMRSSSLRADDEPLRDGPMIGSLGEEGEHLPLPPGELGKLANGLVARFPAPL